MRENRARGSVDEKLFAPLLSEPVTISRPGVVSVRSGPFKGLEGMQAFAFSVPPDLSDYADVLVGAGELPRIVEEEAGTFVYFKLLVRSVTRRYEALRIWVH